MLYEVLSPGYHSPLTKTQIAELFRAGRLGRQHRCKAVSHKEWRTVDELFPLLKYQSTTFVYDEPTGPDALPPENRGLISVGIFTAAALAVLWFWFKQDSAVVESTQHVPITETRRPTTPVQSVAPQPFLQNPPQQQQSQANRVVVTPPATTTELPRFVDNSQARLAAQEREAEERQRRQAEYSRLQEERDRQEQKARGQDIIFPLDQDMVVTVGGVGVTVKIHDNDIKSFDVWINGVWHRAVPKQKGVTHSRTDETLIYNGGRARLYYVWELSGRLNHCLLRVREQ